MGIENCHWCGAHLPVGKLEHFCPSTRQVMGVLPYWDMDAKVVPRPAARVAMFPQRRAVLALRILARVALGLLIVALFVACSGVASRALAQEYGDADHWIDHWFESDCCSGEDCRLAPAGSVRWTPSGWFVPAGNLCLNDVHGNEVCTGGADVVCEGERCQRGTLLREADRHGEGRDPRLRQVPPNATAKDAQRIWPCWDLRYLDGVAYINIICLYTPIPRT